MNMSQMGRYLFLAGVVVAVAAGLLSLNIPHLATILAVAGVVVGFLNVSGAESRTFLIAGIAFLATAGALNGLAAQLGAGSQMAAVSAKLAAFAAPAVLIVALKSLLSTAGD